MKNNIFYLTDRGNYRVNNEDSCYGCVNKSGDYLLVVCDGIGSYLGSDLASKIMVDIIKKDFLEANFSKHNIEKWFYSIVEKTINEYKKIIMNDEEKNKMSTTIALAIVTKNVIHYFWSGDSRIYLATDDKINLLTEDHNLFNHLKKNNCPKSAFAQNAGILEAIVYFIGIGKGFPHYSYSRMILPKKSCLIVTSDGFHNFYNMKKIFSKLRNIEKNEDLIVLINEAIKNGSNDNLSIAFLNN